MIAEAHRRFRLNYDAPLTHAADGSLAFLFEAVVEREPESCAVRTQSTSLSYQALNVMANRIGHAIVGRAGPMEQPVALIMSHDVLKIAAVLGVLKAGYAYAVLNIGHNDQGLLDLAAHAGSDLILTDESNYTRVFDLLGRDYSVVNIAKIGSEMPSDNLCLDIPKERTARIHYTSGSTGSPKGVVMTHEAAVQLIRRASTSLDIHPQDRVAFFDQFWIMALFGSFLNGACLVPFNIARHGLARVGPWLSKNRITILPIYPTAFRQIVGSLNRSEPCSSVRVVYVVGESGLRTDIDLFRKHFPPDSVFVSGYGCTEFGNATSLRIHADDSIDWPTLPAGFVHEGLKIGLVDELGRSVRTGEVGEIVITSRYLTSGYRGRADLTEGRFVHSSDQPEIVTFHTGDMGRLDSNNCLFVLGRKDQQVKIRNHRVIPSEIEDVLIQYDAVNAAAVTTYENQRGDTRLAGHVVLRSDEARSTTDLRAYLQAKLPPYMVPSTILLMSELPLTKTGKIDRRALPKPTLVARDDPTSYLAPRSALEVDLKLIWEELLGLSGIGVDDDFFDAGGDSLQATRLILEVGDRYGIEFDAETIMVRVNTIARMAEELERGPEKHVRGKWDRLASVPRSLTIASEPGRHPSTPHDVDFVEFGAPQDGTDKSGVFYIDPETFLRRARPHATLGVIRFNALGFRGPELTVPKPKGRVRLAFLGSSNAYDSHASGNEATWPHLVWSELQECFSGVELDYVNAGMPGYNTRAMKALFSHNVAELEPNVVIISTGDINADTAYFARRAGIYAGVHYRPSRLAKASFLWRKIEKNLTVLWRLLFARSERNKLTFESDDLTRGFERRLEDLVFSCVSNGAVVVLVCGTERLRPDQSWWQQTRASITHVLYMPYMSLRGISMARAGFNRVIRQVAARTGTLLIDVSNIIPADSHHYADSNHFRDAGSKIMAHAVVQQIKSASHIRALLS